MKTLEKLNNKRLLLASGSPRRQELISKMDLEFTVVKQDVDESFPEELQEGDVAEYLAKKKADFYADIQKDEILITADTIVCHKGQVLNKPADRQEAIEMLTVMSGQSHKVFTGVSIRSSEKSLSFNDCTKVFFAQLSEDEISYYVDKYRPFDKAGGYGIQDWIGLIGIERLEGCYYNVMGLPVSKLYKSLVKLVE